MNRGNVTAEAIFIAAATRMTAIMSKADLPASLGVLVFSNMFPLYASLDNTAISVITWPMEKNSNLDRIRIVLVEPQDGANIGSVCRAMKTMGIHDLAITGDRQYDENRVRTLALHAYDLYENHSRYANLAEALSDSVLSVGASRRRGKNRKYFALLPEQMAKRIDATGEGRVSIVFGREADGLTDAELNLCHMGVRIPTSDAFPSLNLSQAVQVITYTLFRELTSTAGFEPIVESRLQKLSQTVGESFEKIDFFKQDEKSEVERFFRDIFARATLSEGEAKRLEKMFIKMARIRIHKNMDKDTRGQ
jgi:tRNA/rRNA methyltransferase